MSLIDSLRTMFLLPTRLGSTYEQLSLDTAAENRVRIDRYKTNWRDYRGLPIAAAQSEDKTPITYVNFLRRNIDKINWFAFGRPFKLTHYKYQEQLDVALQCWGPKRVEKMLRVGQFGSVTGDAFIMVAPAQVAEQIVQYNKELVDYEVKIPAQVRVVPLNPAYCTPTYDAFDSDVLVAMDIDIPVRKYEASTGQWTTTYYHQTITKNEIITSSLDNSGKEIMGTRVSVPNPIKTIYVVHIRNYPCGDSVYGMDDITEAASLNSALANAIANIGQILKYHGDPITIIFGAKSSNLKKGANKIWGNLPKDAKVENLALNTDLTAANTYMDTLKESLHATMGVPEIAQGTKQAISNTSGVALHTMYLPLIERAVTKHQIYGPSLTEVSILSIKWLEELNLMYSLDEEGNKKPKDGRTKKLTDEDYESIRQDSELRIALPLPKDRLIEAQIQTTLMAGGLQTTRDALVELGEARPDEKAEEIKEEAEEKQAKALELMTSEATIAAKNKPDGSGIASGAGANQGEPKEESDTPKGRPVGSTKDE